MVHKEADLRKMLGDFNATAGETGKVDVDKVVAALAGKGAGVQAAAAELSFEEIASCGVPQPLARAIARMFRDVPAKPEPVAAKSEVQVGSVGASMVDLAVMFGNLTVLGDRQVLEMYHPLERPHVADELRKRCGNRPFIVFSDKNALQVDVDKSLELLLLMRQGVEVGTETVLESGVMTELFVPGEMPDAALDICPVHGEHLVGPSQYCKSCKRGWRGIEQGARELAYIQAKEVWGGERPQGGTAELMMLFAVLKDPTNEYWAQARMMLERYTATGQVIILRRPIERRRVAQVRGR